MSKYRIHIEEVHEDGSVTPFVMEDGSTPGIPDREGFLIVAVDDVGDSCDCSTLLHGLDMNMLATAISGHPVLRKAATLVSITDILERKIADLKCDDEEDDDASD